jgi:hypothetical protein
LTPGFNPLYSGNLEDSRPHKEFAKSFLAGFFYAPQQSLHEIGMPNLTIKQERFAQKYVR